jgi:hypothetical protein
MKTYRTILYVFAFLLLGNVYLFAQEEQKEAPVYGWKNEVLGSLNLTQASFDNWSQGGENSLSWQFNLITRFIKDEASHNWANTGKFEFGQIRVGDQSSRKSVDEIMLESTYTFKLGWFVDPYISLTALTQFTEGFDYGTDPKTPVSNFLDPGYFTQSIGVGYTPNDMFKTKIGAALRETVTSDFNLYADDPLTSEVEKTKTEGGVESVTDFIYKMEEDLVFTSNLRLFSNLIQFEQIVVRWDNLVTAKITKYVNVNFNFQLFYDHVISSQRQIKQSLALGISYSFL